MRHLLYFTPLIAAVGTAAHLIAPAAVADPGDTSTLPACPHGGGGHGGR